MLNFSKYSGCGNDFILIDHRTPFLKDPSELAKKICDRHSGVGADGLILLENAQDADAKIHIFNCDGSSASMCGNGLRSAFAFMRELQLAESSALIETSAGVKQLTYLEGTPKESLISAEMGPPTRLKWNLPLKRFANTFEGKGTLHYLDTGVPHAVFLADNLPNDEDLHTLSASLRHHPDFGDEGTNVNLVWQNGDGSLSIRTFERGVEGETLACGTGATASALAASIHLQLPSPVSLKTLSGATLTISFSFQKRELVSLVMTGPVEKITSGSWSWN